MAVQKTEIVRESNGIFKKGHSANLSGRPKGAVNKTTKEIKNAFENLLKKNLDNMTEWLEDVAEQNPAKALEFMYKFAEFSLPKLERTELVGDEENPINIFSHGINFNLTTNEKTSAVIDKMERSKKALEESKAKAFAKAEFEIVDTKFEEVKVKK